MISLQGVTSGTLLRGFTATFERVTFLVDEGDDAAGLVLRLVAGIERPASGRVLIDNVDPATDAALRRDIALLGDAALLGDDEELAKDLARVRGVELGDAKGPRALCDALANDARARVVLLAYPERYLDARDAILARARAAVGRGASLIVATRTLDDVLSLALEDSQRAMGVIISRGVAAAIAPAHALPWAVHTEGTSTRIVRVLVDGAARLSADLLNDERIAPTLALIEPLSADEVRFHTRDARALARAIGERAKNGLAVRALYVIGAAPSELVPR